MSEDLEAAFDTFRTDALRVETLPAYDVPEEAGDIEAWRQGRPRPARDETNDPWLARIARDTAARGRSWRRLRVVSEPLTDYEHWELGEYATEQGEQVRILGRDQHTHGLVDVWLFDTGTPDASAYLLRYTPTGAWLGAVRLSTDDAAHLARQASAAWEAAEPLTRYLAARTVRRETRSA